MTNRIAPSIFALAFLQATLLLHSPLLPGQASAPKEKSPIHGLVTMGGLAPLQTKGGHADNTLKEANVHPGVYSAVALLFSWEELEPTEGRLDSSRIEAALQSVRDYNKKYPETPVTAKLRIFSGYNTPAWAIAASGGSIELNATHGPVVVGYFWTPAYRRAWAGLQRLLAARYDGEPLLQEVAVSSCATVTAEPFILTLTPESIPKLHSAGFSDAAFKSCLMGALDDYAPWKHTPIDYTLNPFRNSDTGKPVVDPDFPKSLIAAFRERFGKRAVIANHGLQAPMAERQTLLCAALKSYGPPLEFQTISPVVEWDASVAAGLALGASEIEIWNTKDAKGPAPVTYDQLKKWALQFRAVR